MKAILESVVLVSIVAWIMWVLQTSDPCMRVDRAAAPVRGIANMARMVTENWEESESERAKLHTWSQIADEKTRWFIAQQFYGGLPRCGITVAADAQAGKSPSNEIVVGQAHYRRTVGQDGAVRWLDDRSAVVADEFLLNRLDASFAAQIDTVPAGKGSR